MFDFIRRVFLSEHKKHHQKSLLIRPEFGYLFDGIPDEWVSLDLEMTGLNPKTDHILSVGAVSIKHKDGVLTMDTADALSIVCRPPVMPDTSTIVIHGLRPIDVQNGVSYNEMLERLLPFIAGRTVVGFCVDMDMRFLNALAAPYLGVKLPNKTLDVSVLDQKIRQKKQRDPNVFVEKKHLNQLLKSYKIPLLPAHDALNDAMMTAMLFCHLNKNHP
ncbi:3'-5' exonuclease [Moraxella nasovis]|uniref:3'-5' exonuclease n=1 Tax=Moraxella nasovis TaxID=2904121 RepID=UPI001F61D043|nr:3'-5' exonuclease [Moraxella nasovis]UNU73691.1 3'-5' exonuclease [Moraxella nasovis]